MPSDEHGRRTLQFVKVWLLLWLRFLRKIVLYLAAVVVGLHLVMAPLFVGVYIERGVDPIAAWGLESMDISGVWMLLVFPWVLVLGTGVLAAMMAQDGVSDD